MALTSKGVNNRMEVSGLDSPDYRAVTEVFHIMGEDLSCIKAWDSLNPANKTSSISKRSTHQHGKMQ